MKSMRISGQEHNVGTLREILASLGLEGRIDLRGVGEYALNTLCAVPAGGVGWGSVSSHAADRGRLFVSCGGARPLFSIGIVAAADTKHPFLNGQTGYYVAVEATVGQFGYVEMKLVLVQWA